MGRLERAGEHLQALLRAVTLVPSDLPLDDVLRALLESARELTGAEHCAMIAFDPMPASGSLVYVGPDVQAFAGVADQLDGSGLLKQLADQPAPLRLPAPQGGAGADPASAALHSFLGVAVPVREEVYGVICLVDAPSGRFTDEDEDMVCALALAAGGSVRNARMFEESRLQQRWLQASAQIGSMLHSAPDDDPLVPIARCAHAVAEADLVTIGVLSSDRSALVIEAAFGSGAARMLGARYDLGDTLFAEVVANGRSTILDVSDVGEQVFGPAAEVFSPGSTMMLPLVGTGDVRGTISVLRRAGRPRFTEVDREMALGFASHSSIALELSDSRTAEYRLMLLEDRDRIAMDLHDHVIQELFAIGLSMESMATTLGLDHPVAERLVGRVDDVDRVIKRIRASIFELRGSVTSVDGLRQLVVAIGAELRPALGLNPKMTFAGSVGERVDAELRDDVEACVRESLANVAKHARASAVAVHMTVAAGVLTVRVTDDGVGPGPMERRSGTANLRARADRRGGGYAVEPGPGGGTVVTWRVPITRS